MTLKKQPKRSHPKPSSKRAPRGAKRVSASGALPVDKRIARPSHPRGGVLKPDQHPPASEVFAQSHSALESSRPSHPKEHPFIVGIGASAGGLEAYKQFFRHMPADSGIAFVLISHLDPQHVTHLHDLIAQQTRMPVHLVTDRMKVEPNTVYVIPPDCLMGILNRRLHLVRRINDPGGPSTITYFMRTLAEDQGDRAICIVLSGMGSDGSPALKAVKHESGLVIAQDPATARYPSMPSAAIETGAVDFVLAPEKMPEQILSHVARMNRKHQHLLESGDGRLKDHLEKIFLALRSSTGHDFSSYKRSTIIRRIQRRMEVHQLESLQDYVELLTGSTEEVKILLEELLIGVTRFFRDPEAFEALRRDALLPLLKDVPADHVVRVWIPGCSGGEEPYSIAMLLQECLEELQRDLAVQIFATDIDSHAIEKARLGLYPQTIADDVGPERLKKFFTREEQAYRVKAALRQKVIFAPQNVIKDPPFTRLDLLCCRNLLIYFDTGLQKKLLPLFHYTLQPNGILFLGTSETIGEFSDYFSTIDKKWKIFRKRNLTGTNLPQVEFPAPRPPLPRAERESRKLAVPALSRVVERTLLNRFAPPCAIIDLKGDVLYIHGRTGGFLEPAAGLANWNIIEMAREGLKLPLSNAIRKASAANSEVTVGEIKVKTNGSYTMVDITVKPIASDEVQGLQGLLMITFERALSIKKAPGAKVPRGKSEPYLREMEGELKRTKEHLQSSIEEMETANEELRSINEEYQSTNEELQSANEELNTSREEMQSLNEELETVNTEYQNQLEQLQTDYLDLHDLIEGLQVPIVLLDTELRVKRYTSSVTHLANLIPSDIGRPLSDITHGLKYRRLMADAAEVLASLAPKLIEIETTDGQWLAVSIRPSRGSAHSIRGVSISFFDITRLKLTELELRAAAQQITQHGQLAEEILDTLRNALLVLSEDLRVIRANRSFYDLFHTSPEATEGKLIYELGNRQWDIPQLRKLLEEVLPTRSLLYNYEVTHSFPSIGTRTMILNARQLATSGDAPKRILLVIEDRTGASPDGQAR